jgi:MFS family permease
MRRLFQSRWVQVALGILGFGLLGSYIVVTGDWRVSPLWALAFPAISFSVAWAFVGLKLFDRLPKLNAYLLHPNASEKRETPLSGEEWSLRQANYLDSGFRGKAILTTPAEEGLICVPVLLVGIGSVSAVLGGIAFGFIHLGRFTYLECIGKSVTYTLACYFVLPHGLLTVAFGHVIMNGIAFVAIQIAKRKLSEKLRSNPTVDADARNSGARGHRER